MAQRIFDTDNEEDMADLWDILPESCGKITVGNIWDCVWENSEKFSYRSLFKINWHDKTEITRPIQECNEQDAGKICVFWDDDGTRAYGLLSDLIIKGSKYMKYGCAYGKRWAHARRLTKEEIEELC